jgi:hypothetical protein
MQWTKLFVILGIMSLFLIFVRWIPFFAYCESILILPQIIMKKRELNLKKHTNEIVKTVNLI